MKRRASALSDALRLAAMLTAVGIAGAPLLPDIIYAQQTGGEIQVMPIRGNVFMIIGGGGHVTLSAGADGLLLVDTGSAAMADNMLATIKNIGNMVAASPGRMTTCVGPTCHAAGTSGPFTP